MPFARWTSLVLMACAACGTGASSAPHVDKVVPAVTCDVAPGATRVLRVSGSGLAPRVVDTLSGTPGLVLPTVELRRTLDANGAPVSGEAPIAALAPRYLATGDIELTVAAGATLATGKYDVTVSDENGQKASLEKAVTVTPPSAAFFVDPQVVWSGASFDLTGWLDRAGVSALHVHVQLSGQPGTRRELTPLSVQASETFSRFQVSLPAQLAAGDYDVIVESEGGCVGERARALHVEGTPSMTLGGLEPDVGVTSEAMAVALIGAGLVPTPRLFLRPTGDATATATPLIALDWQTAARIDAVVKPGLPAGKYDLISITPTGGVSVMAGALELVAATPLEVDSVTPLVMPLMTATPLVIRGRGFATPTVRLRCRPSGGGMAMGFNAPVTSFSATEIIATAPAAAVALVCVVRVINGTTAVTQFSAVAFAAGPTSAPLVDLLQKRRAAAAAVARIRDRPILYVLGGDDGTPGGTLDTVDTCKFDLFGRAVACRPQRSRLSAPRSFLAAARVGRYVYAIGGAQDGKAVRVFERARVLDPADSPGMAGYDLRLGDGQHGLAGGQWTYRISAVFDETTFDETLASQPALVVVPDRPERVQVQLTWAPVEHAARYRIYRTPVGGSVAGGELLLIETTDSQTTWIDEGRDATGVAPLKPLQLGEFHSAGTLKIARAGAAVLTAVDPADPKVTYLYVAGGRDDTGALRDDFEWFKLTDVGGVEQTVDGATMGGSIGGARAQLAAWSASGADVPSLGASETWLYLGGGEGVGGARVSTTVAGRVQADGSVDFATPVNATPTPQTGGSAAVVQRSGLVILGGGGAPSRAGSSAEICSNNGNNMGNCNGNPPALSNWSGLGGNLLVRARYLMTAVRSGPFVFIAGGQADNEAATASVEGGAW